MNADDIQLHQRESLPVLFPKYQTHKLSAVRIFTEEHIIKVLDFINDGLCHCLYIPQWLGQ